MSQRIAVRGVIIDEGGKLFCVKLKAYGGKSERDFWCLPGGGINEGEALITALEREMIEETAVKPIIGNLLYIHQFSYEGAGQFEFFFHVTNTGDYKNIDLSQATHAAEEIDKYGFTDPRTTYLLPEFLTQEDIARHIASHGPTQVFSYL